jgi:predicted esterase
MTVSAFLHEVTTVSDDAPTGAINCTGVTVCVPNPDRSPDAVLGAILAASMGMVTIAPDFIGYGDSVGDWSKYLLAEDYAIATLNMHAAAELLVPMLHSGAGVSSKMVVAGYGEGGYAALAVHRESLNEEWDEAGIIVTASFPSAGPYDLSAEFDRSLAYPWFITQPIYVVYMAFSYSSNMLYGVESLFGGKEAENVVLWFDGSMDPDAITALLFEDEQENNENTFLEVFEKDMLELMVAGTATEFSSALFNNSLNARWASVPSSPIRLCHGSADQDVPYNNSETVMTDLEADGADITLQTLDTCGTHAACAPLCLQHTLLGFQAYTGIEYEPTSGKSTSGHFFSVTHMAVGAVVLVAAVFAAVVYKVKSRKNYYLFEQLP